MYYGINEPRIVHEFMDNEVIAIDFDTGSYFSLPDVAAYVWNQLANGVEDRAIIELLAGQFELDDGIIAKDVGEFIAALAQNQLVAEQASPISKSEVVEEPVIPQNYGKPELQKFSDMEQLLLLDPIHEVDEVAGWPLKR